MQQSPAIRALSDEKLVSAIKVMLGRDLNASINILKRVLRLIAYSMGHIENMRQMVATHRGTSNASEWEAHQKFINFHKRFMEAERI